MQSISGGALGVPRKGVVGEILSNKNTNPSVYRARSDDRRNYCTHYRGNCRTQPPERCATLRLLPSRIVSCCIFGGTLSLLYREFWGDMIANVPPRASLTKVPPGEHVSSPNLIMSNSCEEHGPREAYYCRPRQLLLLQNPDTVP